MGLRPKAFRILEMGSTALGQGLGSVEDERRAATLLAVLATRIHPTVTGCLLEGAGDLVSRL